VDWQPPATGPGEPGAGGDPDWPGDVDPAFAGAEPCAADGLCCLDRAAGVFAGLRVGDGVDDRDEAAAEVGADCPDEPAAVGGAELPQAQTVTAVTTTAASARSTFGSLVRSGNPRPLVLADIPVSVPPLAVIR
jgi:hypothetical protein